MTDAAIFISFPFTCYRRLPLLRTVRARNAFVQILGETRERYGFSLVGYVVVPEHIHLLISEPAKGTPSTVIRFAPGGCAKS
jgi:putative transposase